MATDPLSVEDLTADLRRLGVGAGALIMVHTSLRAVGPVDGGAQGVCDAVEAAIEPGGTVLMTLGARDDRAWVNDRPEAERAGLLAGSEPFDAQTTPADPDVGVMAEVFRTRPRTRVSDHPEGRFGAAGPLAARLLGRVPWHDYYGADSPLERFVGLGGQVLRLGADLDTVTLIHYAEHLVPLPSKRRVRRHRLVVTDAGPAVRSIETLDDSDGIVDHPGEDYFAAIVRAYLAGGRGSVGTVGGATSELIDGADLVAFAVAWMIGHLGRD